MARSKNTNKTTKSSKKTTVNEVKNTNKNSKLVWKENYAGFILGAIILVAVGILVANYFVKGTTNNVSDIKTDVSNVEKLQTVIVEKGESLSSIAKRELGDVNLWPEIVRENELKSTVVEVGQSLRMPNVSSSAATTPTTKPETKTSEAVISPKSEPNTTVFQMEKKPSTGEYAVKEGDTLWEIAIAQYGDPTRWREIAKVNNVKNNSLGNPLIYTGTVIKIPAK